MTFQWNRTVFFLFSLALASAVGGLALAEPSGQQDFMANCARCHGARGNGEGSEQVRRLPGYVSVDLTRLSERNGGSFPRQMVYDAIDGRKRFPAHFRGDMPVWGLEFQPAKPDAASEAQVRRRISALVVYIESLQTSSSAN
jgi:mono/diheme cytochrome c family protein